MTDRLCAAFIRVRSEAREAFSLWGGGVFGNGHKVWAFLVFRWVQSTWVLLVMKRKGSIEMISKLGGFPNEPGYRNEPHGGVKYVAR